MTNAAAVGEGRDRLRWVALGVVYFVWGTTYLAIRVGVRHLPPLCLAGTRYLIAGALLYPFASRSAMRSRGQGVDDARVEGAGERVRVEGEGERVEGAGERPGAKGWLACAVVGILLLVGGNGAVTVAETRLPSGLAAVLVATVPLWIIVFAWPLQHQRVSWRAAVGLVVGLGGVVILVGNGAASGHISGVLIVLGAAASWGLGSVVGRRLALPGHAMLAAAMEMLIAGTVMLVAAACTGEFARIHWASVPTTSWLALAYLIGPGSILGFTAYGYALAHLPVTTVSTYAYVNPVVAVVAGVVLLGERLTWAEGIGAAVIVASVFIILQRLPSAVPPPAVAAPSLEGGEEEGSRVGRELKAAEE